jgi:hypothetical protein
MVICGRLCAHLWCLLRLASLVAVARRLVRNAGRAAATAAVLVLSLFRVPFYAAHCVFSRSDFVFIAHIHFITILRAHCSRNQTHYARSPHTAHRATHSRRVPAWRWRGRWVARAFSRRGGGGGRAIALYGCIFARARVSPRLRVHCVAASLVVACAVISIEFDFRVIRGNPRARVCCRGRGRHSRARRRSSRR